MPALRIPPVPEDEWPEDVRNLLAVSRERTSALPGRRGASGTDTGGSDFFPVLLRHPELFKRWLPFGAALLMRGRLPARDRELLVLRVAWLTQGRIEWPEHVRIAHGIGITAGEVERVIEGPEAEGWEPFERALVRSVDELHRDGEISEATWEVVAARYDDAQLIELPMLVAQYHLVAWCQNSFGLGQRDGLLDR